MHDYRPQLAAVMAGNRRAPERPESPAEREQRIEARRRLLAEQRRYLVARGAPAEPAEPDGGEQGEQLTLQRLEHLEREHDPGSMTGPAPAWPGIA